MLRDQKEGEGKQREVLLAFTSPKEGREPFSENILRPRGLGKLYRNINKYSQIRNRKKNAKRNESETSRGRAHLPATHSFPFSFQNHQHLQSTSPSFRSRSTLLPFRSSNDISKQKQTKKKLLRANRLPPSLKASPPPSFLCSIPIPEELWLMTMKMWKWDLMVIRVFRKGKGREEGREKRGERTNVSDRGLIRGTRRMKGERCEVEIGDRSRWSGVVEVMR